MSELEIGSGTDINGQNGGSGGATPWNPSTDPGLVQSGQGILGKSYILLSDFVGSLDGMNDLKSGDIIWFNGSVWKKIHPDLYSRVVILEASVFFNGKGEWDASTNTPNLNVVVAVPADTYLVSVSGSQNIGNGLEAFSKGDLVYRLTNNTWVKLATASEIDDAITSATKTWSSSKTNTVINTEITNRTNADNALDGRLDIIEGSGVGSIAKAQSDAIAFSVQRANHTGTQLASTISDFTEATQDAIGASLTDTNSIDLTYNDATNQITADLKIQDSTTIDLSIDASGLKADVIDASITNVKVASGIDAVKIGNGSVSNSEFQTLSDINTASTIQTQLNTKALDSAVVHNTGAETVAGVKTFSSAPNLSSLTASQRLELDASKNIVSVAKNTADNKNFESIATEIKMNGVQGVGTSSNIARADHVHPSDTSKQNLITSPTNNNITTTDGAGQTKDSGKSFSTDTTFSNNSDSLIPTEKASKTYIDNAISTAVTGLWDYRGAYDASVNTYPTTGGSGTAGAVLKSDVWVISVAGTLGGVAVNASDLIIAKIDTPGQTSANWSVIEGNLGYTPENIANKENTTLDTNTTKYPTVNLVKTKLDAQKDVAETLTNKTISADSNTITNIADASIKAGAGIASSKIKQATIAPVNTPLANDDTQDVINNKLQGQVNNKFDKSTSQEISSLSAKTSIVGNDVILGENSANSYSKVKLLFSDIFTFIKNTFSARKIYYVSSSGDNANNGLTPETAVLTLAQALILSDNSGNQICVLPGTYNENTTITDQNLTITASNSESGGIVNFTGTLTFNHSASSIRLNGLNIANLVHSGAGSLYANNCAINTSTSLSGSGYVEFTKTDMQGASFTGTVSITGSGSKVFQNGCTVGAGIINNASAIVSYINCLNGLPITLTLGTLNVFATPIYSAGSSFNAISASSGSILYLTNASCLNPDSSFAKINVASGAFYSLANAYYNIASSTISGTQLTREAKFDKINADAINIPSQTASTILSLDSSKNITALNTTTYPSLSELSYVKGVTSSIQTQLNNKQNLDATLTALAALDSSAGSLYQTGADTFVKDNAATATSRLNAFAGDSGSGGIKGLVPAPTTGDANKFLKGDGTWATQSGLSDGDKGDITVSSNGTTWTIDNDTVNTNKLASQSSKDVSGLTISNSNKFKVLQSNGTNLTLDLSIPTYTTTQRNALTNVPTNYIISNSTTGVFEKYNGTSWDAATQGFMAGDGISINTGLIPNSINIDPTKITGDILASASGGNINMLVQYGNLTKMATGSFPVVSSGKLGLFAGTNNIFYGKTSDGNLFALVRATDAITPFQIFFPTQAAFVPALSYAQITYADVGGVGTLVYADQTSDVPFEQQIINNPKVKSSSIPNATSATGVAIASGDLLQSVITKLISTRDFIVLTANSFDCNDAGYWNPENSGVTYCTYDGQTITNKPFGIVNQALEVKFTLNTKFNAGFYLATQTINTDGYSFIRWATGTSSTYKTNLANARWQNANGFHFDVSIGTQGGGGEKIITVNYPVTFPVAPEIVLTMIGENFPDCFAASVRGTPGVSSCQVNVARTNNGGWGQNPTLRVRLQPKL